ncbi:MAG: hypothetical protein WDM94_07440 [Bauldia sp.]
MSEYRTDQQRFLDPGIRKFWPNFVVAAVLTPLMWVLLVGLTLPDDAIGFYIVVIIAVPLALALVLLPAWRLIRREASNAIRVAVAVLALPALGIFLWGAYCALLLVSLILTGDL